MEPSANLILSEPELAKVQDANWIFTKHLIMEKAAAILRGQVQEINNQFNFYCSGMRLKNLQLQCPKFQKAKTIFNFHILSSITRQYLKRTTYLLCVLFLVGKFFSINLHISGIYKTAFQDTLLKI